MTTTNLKFSNFASTTIVGSVSAVAGTLVVANAAAFPPANGTTYFYAVITDSLTAPTKREIVKVTNVSGTTFSITRGQDGTSAQSWVNGNYIELRVVNQALQDLHSEAVSSLSSVSSLTSTTDITANFDSDNNGSGDLYFKKGGSTVAKLTNAGNLLADPSYANILNPRWGGDNTGTNDNVAAVNAAIAAGYTSIYFPSGSYKFLSGLSFSGKNIRLFGDGAEHSVLFSYDPLNTTAFDLITFTGTYSAYYIHQLVLEGISVQTRVAKGSAGGYGVKVSHTLDGAVGQYYPVAGAVFRNFSVRAGVDNACFAYGISLNNTPFAKFDNVFASGWLSTDKTNPNAGSRAGVGFDFIGAVATDMNVTDTVVYQAAIGIQASNSTTASDNQVQGMHIANATILNCSTGVKIGRSTAVIADGEPGWYIHGCHISATDVGIDSECQSQYHFTNNLIYGVGGTTFSAMKLVSNNGASTDGIVLGNTLIKTGAYSGNTYGINFVSSTGTPGPQTVRVSANGFENFTNAVFGDSTVSGVVVTPDNRVISGGGYNLIAAGNVISGFSGNIGLNVTPPDQDLSKPMLYFGNGIAGFAQSKAITTNGYWNGTNWKYIFNDYAYSLNAGGSGGFIFYSASSGTAGNNITYNPVLTVNQNGEVDFTNNLRMPNTKILYWKNASGTLRSTLQMAADNTLYLDSWDNNFVVRTGTTPTNALVIDTSQNAEFSRHVVMPNAITMRWRDSGGDLRDILQMYSDNSVYLTNPYPNGHICIRSDGGGSLQLRNSSNNTILQTDNNNNVVMGNGALATNATNGFFYVDSCAGAPTGVPTTYTGRVPLVYDTTNNKLYAYNGAWKSVTLA